MLTFHSVSVHVWEGGASTPRIEVGPVGRVTHVHAPWGRGMVLLLVLSQPGLLLIALLGWPAQWVKGHHRHKKVW